MIVKGVSMKGWLNKNGNLVIELEGKLEPQQLGSLIAEGLAAYRERARTESDPKLRKSAEASYKEAESFSDKILKISQKYDEGSEMPEKQFEKIEELRDLIRGYKPTDYVSIEVGKDVYTGKFGFLFEDTDDIGIIDENRGKRISIPLKVISDIKVITKEEYEEIKT